MVVREIIVVKKPRDDSLQDKPISFPALENLHLDMMENKKKLKKGLPLIVVGGGGGKPQEKKAAIYPQAVISGLAGAVAGAAAAASKKPSSTKRKEKFTPAHASADASSSSGKKTKTVPLPDADEEASADLLDNLAEDGAEDAAEDDGVEDAHDDEADDDGHGDGGSDGGSDRAAGTGEADVAEEDDPYAGLSPEERERQEKEEYIWRFKILKKKYKTRKDIADYNEHDDLFTMKQTYERTLREIQLEDNCESYRMYLVGGFMLMEFVSNNWMGVDLTGFTAHQMTMMHKYDRMLIELGEKSYNRWGSNLPVEIRLIGFIIIQAGIFYLGKIIAEKGGGTMADIFKMFTGAPAATGAATEGSGTTQEQDPDAPKRKMRGPSVKVADLRKKVET